MSSLMSKELLLRVEFPRTVRTLVLADLEVFPFPVVDEGRVGAEGVSALRTEIRLDPRVHGHVDFPLLEPRKRLWT